LAATIRQVKLTNPQTTIEVLIPDFDGKEELVKQQIIEARPEVISHNLETVRRLTPMVRSRAKYDNQFKSFKANCNIRFGGQIGHYAGFGRKTALKYWKPWTTL
jgi:lipoic acid synthetase